MENKLYSFLKTSPTGREYPKKGGVTKLEVTSNFSEAYFWTTADACTKKLREYSAKYGGTWKFRVFEQISI